jgi:hypothetical protein
MPTVSFPPSLGVALAVVAAPAAVVALPPAVVAPPVAALVADDDFELSLPQAAATHATARATSAMP